MKIAVTGCNGLLGWHTCARLHAVNCAAAFAGNPKPHSIVRVDRQAFEDPDTLSTLLEDVDAIIHFAGVNRGPENEVEQANPAIAENLVSACRAAKAKPTIVYANSTHAATDTPYGRSKRKAGEILSSFATNYVDLVLPHIFGECARPYYNNVTATLIDKILAGDSPDINPDGRVHLLHAGAAADIAIDAAINGESKTLNPDSTKLSIQALFDKLTEFHTLYSKNIFPRTDTPFELQLFNSYRTAGYPSRYPSEMTLNKDVRGTLFEAAKGGCGSQTFLSSTAPGVTRGDHFHLDKIERFLVVKGEAVIRLRKVLTNEIVEFAVSGDKPVAIDMIPLHTHSIENTGNEDLFTLFWTHEMFDPQAPDTYADPVLS